jgi:signal transduction histidine kinase
MITITILSTFLLTIIIIYSILKNYAKEIEISNYSNQVYQPVTAKELSSLPNLSVIIDSDIAYCAFKHKIYVYKQDKWYETDIPYTINIIIIYMILLLTIYTTISISLFSYYVRAVRTKDLLRFSDEKTTLSNLITTVLTENLHHELKTPLAAISSEIMYIEEDINNILEERNCLSCKMYVENSPLHSFENIKTNLGIIYNIIETMKMSKIIKHSNGSKSIYDVVDSASKIMLITSKVKNFSIEIEEDLKNYSLNGFRNEDLLNILINHFKNSIEACSTKIVVKNLEGVKDNKLKFYIIDNGNGIPKNAIDKIYDLHFSTKPVSEKDSTRGVGLFLSREILRQYGKGDEKLYSTSKEGTIFEISVPAKIKNS